MSLSVLNLRVHATPEESYNLMYHNEDFLKSIWENQAFRGEWPELG
jgi:hypothetical protein